jgi:threonine dehydratase
MAQGVAWAARELGVAATIVAPDQAPQTKLDAIERLGGAPELYAVDDTGPRPVALANRIQAWTVGARMALEAAWDGRAPELERR